MRRFTQWLRYLGRDPWDAFNPAAVAEWPSEIRDHLARAEKSA